MQGYKERGGRTADDEVSRRELTGGAGGVGVQKKKNEAEEKLSRKNFGKQRNKHRRGHFRSLTPCEKGPLNSSISSGAYGVRWEKEKGEYL